MNKGKYFSASFKRFSNDELGNKGNAPHYLTCRNPAHFFGHFNSEKFEVLKIKASRT